MVSDQDRDLLSRLNALKKSPVELDQGSTYTPPVRSQAAIDPSPARALGGELASRFKTLSASRRASTVVAQPPFQSPSTALDDAPTDQSQSFDAEVEALLASLGPEEQWDVQHGDKRDIDKLLKAAQNTLSEARSQDSTRDSEPEDARASKLPTIDVSVFQPDLELDGHPSQPQPGKSAIKPTLDEQADDILQRILDEIAHEPPPPYPAEETEQESVAPDPPRNEHTTSENPALSLPSTPSKDPLATTSSPTTTDAADADLASRFASLSLPSVPTSLKTSNPTKPTAGSAREDGDEEVETWCTICLADATVSCPGCDDDLYCAVCWVEGHRGPDAGLEEKTHRAVLFNKRKKKERRKVALGG